MRDGADARAQVAPASPGRSTGDPRAVPTVGIGIVGAGALSRRLVRHLTLDDMSDRVAVVHVCDPVEARAVELARSGVDGRASASIGELLADERVDVVTVASPIGLHFEHGLAAIRAGKHVHFNKTMALTAAEATQLIDAASAREVRLVSSPGEMLRPHHRHIKALLADGAIGRLCWAACGAAMWSYHEDEPDRSGEGELAADPSWYYRAPGGGPLYDMTVYALHAMTGILGSVRRVTAMSGIRIPQRTIGGRPITTTAHDNTLILLDFGEGLLAMAYGTASGILTEGRPWDIDGRYYGTSGSIVGKTINGQPLDYPGSSLASQAENGDQWLLPYVDGAHRDLLEQHVFADVMQLVDWVTVGTPAAGTAEHARHVVEIIEAAYRAAESGQTQTLTTTISGLRSALGCDRGSSPRTASSPTA
jgi:predicted dehydrogenase